MTITMRYPSMNVMALVRRSALLVAGLATLAASASAQSPDSSKWRLGASAGAFLPRSALIKTTDGQNTTLNAGPAFALDVQYSTSSSIAIYGNLLTGGSSITLGTAIQPGVVGPSNQVLLLGGTAGVLFTPGSGPVQVTLRAGGGFKGYMFDLTGAEDQWSPTVDLGLGFRGGSGPIGVSAEVRYLGSTFDQSKLPIRGITAQDQQQNDLFFSVGISIRP